MSNKDYKEGFLPVDPDFIEVIENAIAKKISGKIHYFDVNGELESAMGVATDIVKNSKGEFLSIDTTEQIRLDKIVTLYGLPGPAYDEYDRFAVVCLACEDVGQFGA
jgi:hypothetical protein